MQNKSQMKVHGALLAVALIYGASYSVAKTVMPELIAPFGFILLRVIAGTLIFFAVLSQRGLEKIKSNRDYLRLALCGLFGIAANQLIFFKGLSMTSAIHASVLMTSNPIIVLVLSYFILREAISIKKVIGVVLGLAGATLLIFRGEIGWEYGSFVGDFLILMNSTCYALYLILVNPLMRRYNSLTVISWAFLFGAVFVIPFGYEEFVLVSWSTLPFAAWFSISFIVIFTTVVAYLLNVWSLKFVTPTTVSYYIYLQPIFASVIALFVLDEKLEPSTIIFAVMIFIGVYLVGKR